MKYLSVPLMTVFSLCLTIQTSYGMEEKVDCTPTEGSQLKRKRGSNNYEENGTASLKKRRKTKGEEQPLFPICPSFVDDIFPVITAYLGSPQYLDPIIPFDPQYPNGLSLRTENCEPLYFNYHEEMRNLRVVSRTFRRIVDFYTEALDLSAKPLAVREIKERLKAGQIVQIPFQIHNLVAPFCSYRLQNTKVYMKLGHCNIKNQGIASSFYDKSWRPLSIIMSIMSNKKGSLWTVQWLNCDAAIKDLDDHLRHFKSPFLEYEIAPNHNHPNAKLYTSLSMDFKYFPNLNVLNLKENEVITDDQLRLLTNLTSLNIRYNEIITADSLACLPKLKVLDITGTLIVLKDLYTLTNLETLYIDEDCPDIGEIVHFPIFKEVRCKWGNDNDGAYDSMAYISHALISFITTQGPLLAKEEAFPSLKEKCEKRVLLPKALGLGIFKNKPAPQVFDYEKASYTWDDFKYLQALNQEEHLNDSDFLNIMRKETVETLSDLIKMSGKNFTLRGFSSAESLCIHQEYMSGSKMILEEQLEIFKKYYPD